MLFARGWFKTPSLRIESHKSWCESSVTSFRPWHRRGSDRTTWEDAIKYEHDFATKFEMLIKHLLQLNHNRFFVDKAIVICGRTWAENAVNNWWAINDRYLVLHSDKKKSYLKERAFGTRHASNRIRGWKIETWKFANVQTGFNHQTHRFFSAKIFES